MATPKKPTKSSAKSLAKSSTKKTAKPEGATSSERAMPTVAINEEHAKQVAASLINRAKQAPAAAVTQESADFKRLKESLGKPQHAITSPLAGGNKIGGVSQASAFVRQQAHNQNMSANFNKTGVPRRTSGG
ncbi:MAG: hypothetical protein ACTHM6_06515 [Tepidisphaeraceae bacterium]